MTRRRSFVLLAVVPALGSFALTQGAHAQTTQRQTSTAPLAAVDPALFKGLRYRMVGPNRGGRTLMA